MLWKLFASNQTATGPTTSVKADIQVSATAESSNWFKGCAPVLVVKQGSNEHHCGAAYISNCRLVACHVASRTPYFSGPSWHSTIKIVLLPLILGDDSLLAPLAVEVRHKSFIQLTLHRGQMLLLNAVEPVLFVTTADQSSAAMPSYAPGTCPEFTAKPQVSPHHSLSYSLSSIKSK